MQAAPQLSVDVLTMPLTAHFLLVLRPYQRNVLPPRIIPLHGRAHF